MGGGGSKSQTTSDKETQKSTKLLREEVQEPLINTVMPQWLQLMVGKIPQATIPMIQGQVTNARSSSSSSMNALNEMLAKTGLIGSSYGVKSRAQGMADAELSASSVPQDLAMEMFKMSPGMLSETNQTIVNNKGTKTTGTSSDGGAGAMSMGTSAVSALAMAWMAY